MATTLDGVTRSTCPNECPEANITVEFLIDAAPEYLCVVLQIIGYDAVSGEFNKNRNPIQVPDILDLTEYMDHESDNPLPVRYRLSSAIYHTGDSLLSGHYGAGVTSGRGQRARFQKSSYKAKPASGLGTAPNTSERADNLQFFCNDTEITDWNASATVQNKLTINPVDFSDEMDTTSTWDPYTLWYVREPRDAPARVVAVAPVEEEDEADTIGGRLRARKRKRKRAESRDGL